ncbi:DNA (cytosine-5-)-methyltransferase [Hymenobacter sp. BT594]|uniref:Cytosine-specific methyltransferase n=1 Tax=Hymenobacter guriensis TaxID=2793065 RepID=A0ABS0KWS7_9BACT|nr:DNA (cytosine-5-)-methyltransferase [Hymenobacter guriensis]
MRHAGLFSGIGGFSLAALMMGWENVFEVELDEWCRKVLHKNFPNSLLFDDVCTFDGLPFRGLIDVLSGGFPCQPWSSAGQRKGTADPRHLWPHFLRIIREIQPRFVVGENVRGLLNWGGGVQFETVCADLEAAGYEVQPLLLPAAGVGAPHHRDRIWFVAHARREFGNWRQDSESGSIDYRSDTRGKEEAGVHQRLREAGLATNPYCIHHDRQQNPSEQTGRAISTPILCHAAHARCLRCQNRLHGYQPGGQAAEHGDSASQCLPENAHCSYNGGPQACGRESIERHTSTAGGNGWRLTEPPLCVGNDGIPVRLVRPGKYHMPERRDRNRILKAGGNAIVPQVAYEIFRAIEATA